ncbi:MAG: FIST N-terminal domain-containing protein [Candidatus Melainabacteria bacterium]|nr:FIST N-terminal domain-containing protein [Candidatus Melainabacteria bacterium]
MKWASSIWGPESLGNSRKDLQLAIDECAKKLKEEIDDIDLVVGFVSPHFADHFDDFPALVKEALGAKVFIGCTAGGLIGDGKEIEHTNCVALTAASLPDVQVKPFHVTNETMPDLDASPDAWEKIIGVSQSENPAFVLMPDPFTMRSDDIIRGLDYAYPNAVKIGGLASGAHEPGGNALFLDQKTIRDGLVGIALTGNVIVDTVVAQGCKPIGKPCQVTRAQKHILFELDGEPAIMFLRDMMDSLSDVDRSLAKDAMFLGLVMQENKDKHQAGDFLVRNILGIDQNSGALVVGEILDNARTVQFHVRDAATSADDLRFLLKRFRDEKLDGDASGVKGALLFSCLGRGMHLYGMANHDSDSFRDYLGAVPVGGFFCNGEIGPVGNQTYLHGYTSSFGIFRQKTMLN